MNGAENQIKLIANYIMETIPGEPSQSEGAGETAVCLLKRYRQALTDIIRMFPPQYGHVTTVCEIAQKALLETT